MDNGKKIINVLHLRDSPWVDGPGRTIHESAAAIDKTRVNYIIGAFRGQQESSSPFIDEARSRNLSVITIQEKGSFDLSTFRQILDLIDKYNVHILHTHEFRSDLIGLICARKKRIPVISTVHGFISNDFKGKVYTLANKILLRFFDRILVVSSEMKRQLENTFVSSHKISVLYNALVIERYQINRQENDFRKELNISDDVNLIANIGRLSPEKGQRDFLLAASQVVEKHSNVLFLFIGIGPEEDDLRQYVAELGLDEKVKFLGYRKDMINIYNGLNIIVQSSYTEGMPNVILEALIMGLKVIATDVGGTAEVMDDGKSGILIKPKKPEQIAEHIISFIQNPEHLSANRTASQIREDICQRFSFSERTKKLMTIYDESVDSVRS